jgi:vancomycin resistance protein YoaR
LAKQQLVKIPMVTAKIPQFINKKFVKITILVFYVLLILTVVFHFVYAKKIIPGVHIGVTNVGGKSFSEAKSTLTNKLESQKHDLTLVLDEKKYLINSEDISLKYDVDNSISRAFEVGRTGNLFTDTKDKIAGFMKPLSVPAFFDYDDEVLSKKFSIIKAEVNSEAQNASVFVEDNIVKITSSKSGKKVVDDGLYAVVMTAYGNVDFSQKLVPVKVVVPSVKEQDIDSLLTDIRKIVMNTLKVKFRDMSWELGTEQLIDMFEVRKNGKVELGISEPKLEAFMDSVAQSVNQLPRGLVTGMDGNNVTEFVITTEGRETDLKAFAEAFRKAYFNGDPEVEVPVISISGPADPQKYGIYSLLGEGSSKYAGSISSRIHNLTLAAERTSGVLVPPNGIYSLNNAIGEISAATGYNSAYIISKGRTVLGEGGGVCQTSTTLFRAVLNAGLPVVSRYPHAYRVSYYEQDSGPGLDASIFQPSVDFQFKNDTPNYILVQAYPDPTNVSLIFRIFGTPDGRTVEMTTPIITSQSAPPAPFYQDDPTKPKGYLSQIEHAAWGATVKFSRTVKRGDEVISDDTFVSNYQPWRAIYIRGTKE